MRLGRGDQQTTWSLGSFQALCGWQDPQVAKTHFHPGFSPLSLSILILRILNYNQLNLFSLSQKSTVFSE